MITVVKKNTVNAVKKTKLAEANNLIIVGREEHNRCSEGTQLTRGLFVKTNIYPYIMEASVERRLL